MFPRVPLPRPRHLQARYGLQLTRPVLFTLSLSTPRTPSRYLPATSPATHAQTGRYPPEPDSTAATAPSSKTRLPPAMIRTWGYSVYPAHPRAPTLTGLPAETERRMTTATGTAACCSSTEAILGPGPPMDCPLWRLYSLAAGCGCC